MDATGFEAAEAVADAVLYEGYLLYPYRRSSPKNRVRWQFGVLLPEPWAKAHGLDGGGVAGSAESWWQQTECLLTAPADATLTCRLRFLHLRRRTPEERLPDGGHRAADRVGAVLTFDEGIPREYDVQASVAELLSGEKLLDLRIPGFETIAPVPGSAGRTRWREWPLRARVTLSLTPCGPAAPSNPPARAGSAGHHRVRDGNTGLHPAPPPVRDGNAGHHPAPPVNLPARDPNAGHGPLFRLRVRVENAGREWPETPRDEALRRALIACHLLLTVPGGRFVSLLEPPAWAADAARDCVNAHTFPVLCGDEVVLSSPILLYDHPRVAPESPGDLHDAAEIDEILSLRTLTLTDAEKREARATDPRAAAILDRVESMTPEDLSRLHGTTRDPRPHPRTHAPCQATPSQNPPTNATALPETRDSSKAAPSRNPHTDVTASAGTDTSRSATPSRDPQADVAVSVRTDTPRSATPSRDPQADVAVSAGTDVSGGVAPWWCPEGDAGVSPETDAVVVGGIMVRKGSRVRLRPRVRGTDPQDMFLDGRTALVEAVLLDVDGARHLAVTLDDDPAAELNLWYGRFRYFSPDEIEPLDESQPLGECQPLDESQPLGESQPSDESEPLGERAGEMSG